MAITDQLKSLYVKLGGDESTSASNVEEWIDKIEDVAGSGAGSGVYFVNVERRSVDNITQSTVSSATYEEIQNALEAGKMVSVKLTTIDQFTNGSEDTINQYFCNSARIISRTELQDGVPVSSHPELVFSSSLERRLYPYTDEDAYYGFWVDVIFTPENSNTLPLSVVSRDFNMN